MKAAVEIESETVDFVTTVAHAWWLSYSSIHREAINQSPSLAHN